MLLLLSAPDDVLETKIFQHIENVEKEKDDARMANTIYIPYTSASPLSFLLLLILPPPPPQVFRFFFFF